MGTRKRGSPVWQCPWMLRRQRRAPVTSGCGPGHPGGQPRGHGLQGSDSRSELIRRLALPPGDAAVGAGVPGSPTRVQNCGSSARISLRREEEGSAPTFHNRALSVGFCPHARTPPAQHWLLLRQDPPASFQRANWSQSHSGTWSR